VTAEEKAALQEFITNVALRALPNFTVIFETNAWVEDGSTWWTAKVCDAEGNYYILSGADHWYNLQPIPASPRTVQKVKDRIELAKEEGEYEREAIQFEFGRLPESERL
jgi:hypothetical protein